MSVASDPVGVTATVGRWQDAGVPGGFSAAYVGPPGRIPTYMVPAIAVRRVFAGVLDPRRLLAGGFNPGIAGSIDREHVDGAGTDRGYGDSARPDGDSLVAGGTGALRGKARGEAAAEEDEDETL